MESTITSALSPALCDACHVNVSTEDTFCNNCGYPLKGTEDEQRNFMTQLTVNEIDMADYRDQIRKAGNSLFYVAGSVVLGTLLLLATDKSGDSAAVLLVSNAVVCAIFIFLGFWCRKKPFAAIVSGMSLYGILIISSALVNPLTIFSGIIVKIIVIGLLIKGLKSAMAAEKMRKETHLR